jgi:acyl-CoA reductase-like NAD-dependent aldehyde dehydrogenase
VKPDAIDRWRAMPPAERARIAAALARRLEAHRLALALALGRDELEALELAVRFLEHFTSFEAGGGTVDLVTFSKG